MYNEVIKDRFFNICFHICKILDNSSSGQQPNGFDEDGPENG